MCRRVFAHTDGAFVRASSTLQLVTGRIASRLLVLAFVTAAACDKDETKDSPDAKTSSSPAESSAGVSAFTEYQRRSMTSEARVQAATLFDAASAYFHMEHVSRAELGVIGAGGSIKDDAPHECPNDGLSLIHI